MQRAGRVRFRTPEEESLVAALSAALHYAVLAAAAPVLLPLSLLRGLDGAAAALFAWAGGAMGLLQARCGCRRWQRGQGGGRPTKQAAVDKRLPPCQTAPAPSLLPRLRRDLPLPPHRWPRWR